MIIQAIDGDVNGAECDRLSTKDRSTGHTKQGIIYNEGSLYLANHKFVLIFDRDDDTMSARPQIYRSV